MTDCVTDVRHQSPALVEQLNTVLDRCVAARLKGNKQTSSHSLCCC